MNLMADVKRVHLCHRSEIAGPLQRFEVAGHRVLVVDLGVEFIALDDTCTHEEASLAEDGELDVEAREIECCRHGARFSLEDGSAVSLPATTGLRVYPITLDGDDLYLEVSS
ncbi:MAG TPA: Rieske 2Fe-2S domain-containing protein [Acidimicrobiales bacterium]|nr:Rieske 2Fe-2S domain-containing protein [Acidimicrobiales bacterium]